MSLVAPTTPPAHQPRAPTVGSQAAYDDISDLWGLNDTSIIDIEEFATHRGWRVRYKACDTSHDAFTRADTITVYTPHLAVKFFLELGAGFRVRYIGLPVLFMMDILLGVVDYRGERMAIPMTSAFFTERGENCQDIIDIYDAYNRMFG
jgi:hypothetical protein